MAIGLISFIALHIGVLSLGIGNFTKKTAEVKDEPIEIEIVDLQDPQKPEMLPTRRIRRNSTSTQNASSPRRTQTTTSRRRIDTLPPRRRPPTPNNATS